MSKKYEALAKDILENVGGKENVNFVMNCATRLRFQLKDIKKADKGKIENLKGVISVIIQNGQFQVCIGPHVSEVLEEVNKLGNFSEVKVEDNNQKSGMDRFFEVVSGIFTPIVPILMAAGMVGALLALLSGLGIVSTKNPTYYTFNIIREAGFYFLPIFVAYTASKKLNANPYLSMMLGAILLHPQLSNFSALGVEKLDIFGVVIPSVKYANGVLPAILGVWVLSYVENFFKKVFHPVVRSFMAPMMTMLVMLPIMLIVIGPAGSYVAKYIGDFFIFFGDKLGFLAVALLAAFMPLMIATGTHSFAFPVVVATLTTVGKESLIIPSMMAENLAMAGAAFAVATMAKSQEKKAEARAASMSAILGISEPAMYGVNLPLKTPFYATMIGGGIGGLFAGIFKLEFYAIVSASTVGLPGTLNGEGFRNFMVAVGTMIISFIATFIITRVLFKKNSSEKLDSVNKSNSEPIKINVPIKGAILSLDNVKDETFASGAMGKGIAITPEEGTVYSPVDGTIVTIFETKHAICIISNEGAELLIHIGMDTVKLKGRYFESFVKAGQKVSKGDKLIAFDINAIKNEGYDVTTPIIITNSQEYKEIKFTNKNKVNKEDEMMVIK